MERTSLLAGLTLALGIGALPLAPAASAAVDWNAVAGVDVPELVTKDEDGSARVTKLWIVVVDGQGFVRTGETRWAENIGRDADVELRALGEAHPLRAVAVTDVPLRARVNEAFRAKYGRQDSMVSWFADRENAKIFRLDPRAATSP